jgi:hypothetical protein
MAEHFSCPNCSNSDGGTNIYKCYKCRKVYCSRCCKEGLIFKNCPRCENNGEKIGEIRRETKKDDAPDYSVRERQEREEVSEVRTRYREDDGESAAREEIDEAASRFAWQILLKAREKAYVPWPSSAANFQVRTDGFAECLECRNLLSPAAARCIHCGSGYPFGLPVPCVVCGGRIQEAEVQYPTSSRYWDDWTSHDSSYLPTNKVMHHACFHQVEQEFESQIAAGRYNCRLCSTPRSYPFYESCPKCGDPGVQTSDYNNTHHHGRCFYCGMLLLTGFALKYREGTNIPIHKYIHRVCAQAHGHLGAQKGSTGRLLKIGGVAAVLLIGLALVTVLIGKLRGGDSKTDESNRESLTSNPVANTKMNPISANTRNVNRNTNMSTNTNLNAASANTNPILNTNSPDNVSSAFTDDFSAQRWGVGASQFGNMWYQNGEYHMRASTSGYVVMYGPDLKQYSTENATVRVGLRSVDGNSPNTGYGLSVHGEKKDGKLEDYSFVIYNGTGPKYEIVQHQAGVETNLVSWVPSNAIRTGRSPNQIEVRIRDVKLDFYINGQFITSITDSANYRRGRVGFYTSGTEEVAFDDLTITR